MPKFNIHNTNIKINHHVISDEQMRSAGFDRNNKNQSWLLIKPISPIADIWFEIWGDSDDEFCIELLDRYFCRPYTCRSKEAKKAVLRIMSELQREGIITGYYPGMPICREREY